jgi:hypothetical protein
VTIENDNDRGNNACTVRPEPNQVGLEGADDEVPEPNHVTGGLHNSLTARRRRDMCMAAEVDSRCRQPLVAGYEA